MKPQERMIAVVLLALLGAAGAGWLLTRPLPQNGAAGNRRAGPRQQQVDQQPLTTAQQLAPLAATPQEQALARVAMAQADREIDLAFATALRNATDHPPVLTGAALEIQKRLNDLDTKVAADKAEVARLGDAAGRASGARKDQLLKQQELAQAQQALDEDDLADAKADLGRAGGDPQGEIQKEVADHEASMQHAQQPVQAPAAGASATPPSVEATPVAGLLPGLVFSLPIGLPAENIVSQVRSWRKLRTDEEQLLQAQRDAQNLASSLTQDHQQLDQAVSEEKPKQSALTQQAEQALDAGGQGAQQSATDALRSVRRLAGDQTSLADFDKRILAAQRLATVYGRWAGSVIARRRATLHDLMWLVSWILLIALAAICTEVLLGRLFARGESQRDRLHTLVAIIRFSVRALALLVILIVIFGPPNQLATVLALATAGITVALKDFIVGILGWFVLVGRHGIRAGDWVEINGVTGEVVEVGVFSTVLIETGNWSDENKLTGRKVTFNNSFAIEGHYFNFSTSARWIWDELKVIIPFGTDPFAIADSVGKLAADETAANGQQAQKEMESTSGLPLGSFSAAPAVSVKPDPQGAMISVRYLTKAGEQHTVSARLYRRVVEMMGGHKVPNAVEAPEAAKR